MLLAAAAECDARAGGGLGDISVLYCTVLYWRLPVRAISACDGQSRMRVLGRPRILSSPLPLVD